jgi:hypothetical protein
MFKLTSAATIRHLPEVNVIWMWKTWKYFYCSVLKGMGKEYGGKKC